MTAPFLESEAMRNQLRGLERTPHRAGPHLHHGANPTGRKHLRYACRRRHRLRPAFLRERGVVTVRNTPFRRQQRCGGVSFGQATPCLQSHGNGGHTAPSRSSAPVPCRTKNRRTGCGLRWSSGVETCIAHNHFVVTLRHPVKYSHVMQRPESKTVGIKKSRNLCAKARKLNPPLCLQGDPENADQEEADEIDLDPDSDEADDFAECISPYE